MGLVYNKFIIDLNLLSSWLESRKTTLKESLDMTYKINIDYRNKNN